jgi:hypothetical protein
VRGRDIGSALALLRLILAYCLGGKGLRSTAAWAASLGLADISNVALLYRLRQCGEWLSVLVSKALASACPAAQGRMVRIVDATTVPKAGQKAKRGNGLWRIHSAFGLFVAWGTDCLLAAFPGRRRRPDAHGARGYLQKMHWAAIGT